MTPTARLYNNVSFAGSPHAQATQQDAMTIAFGYYFVAFYDSNYEVKLARRSVTGSTWTIVSFGQYVPPTQNPADEDNHDTANVGVSLADGRIHLAYGHHVNNLRYIISDPGAAQASDANFTISLFSSERNYLKSGENPTKVTYPIFVTRPSDNKFYMFWRQGDGGNADLRMATYNNDGTWTNSQRLIRGGVGSYTDPTNPPIHASPSPHRHHYTNDIIVRGNQIQLNWVWRETTDGRTNHDLMYASSTDGGLNWVNTAGTTVATPSTQMNLNSPITVWDINYDWRLRNQTSSYIDTLGNTHIVLEHTTVADPGGDRYMWHYLRKGTTWTRNLIQDASGPIKSGKRPKMFVDDSTNTVYIAANFNASGGTFRTKIFAAQVIDEATQTPDWGVWHKVYDQQTNYYGDLNGRIVGNTLVLLSQKKGASSGATFSPLELRTIEFDPNPYN